jgi:hypothetical protein
MALATRIVSMAIDIMSVIQSSLRPRFMATKYQKASNVSICFRLTKWLSEKDPI